jgi:hypothetical protein
MIRDSQYRSRLSCASKRKGKAALIGPPGVDDLNRLSGKLVVATTVV